MTKPKAKVKEKEKAPEKALPRFSKKKILTLDRYAKRRDLLTALLKDDKFYTFHDVDKLLNDFLKGKVK